MEAGARHRERERRPTLTLRLDGCSTPRRVGLGGGGVEAVVEVAAGVGVDVLGDAGAAVAEEAGEVFDGDAGVVQSRGGRQTGETGPSLLPDRRGRAPISQQEGARRSRESAAQRHEATRITTGDHRPRIAHNPKVAGSNPAPATNETAVQKGFPASGSPFTGSQGCDLATICKHDSKHDRRRRFAGRIVNIDQVRVERLAVDIAPVLATRGNVIVDTGRVDDVDLWRRSARRAGRILGIPVRTGVS